MPPVVSFSSLCCHNRMLNVAPAAEQNHAALSVKPSSASCRRRFAPGMNLTEAFSLSLPVQIDDVIDDIISLESSFNDDIITLIDSGLQLPSTV